LRIKAPKDKLRLIPIGVSADLLVCQKVYAIGNPVSAYNTFFYCVAYNIIRLCVQHKVVEL
jgi:S1-C subfamily serine protease